MVNELDAKLKLSLCLTAKEVEDAGVKAPCVNERRSQADFEQRDTIKVPVIKIDDEYVCGISEDYRFPSRCGRENELCPLCYTKYEETARRSKNFLHIPRRLVRRITRKDDLLCIYVEGSALE